MLTNKTSSLERINMTGFHFSDASELYAGVPGLLARQKHALDLLKRLARGLWEGKEGVHRHSEVEDAEKDVSLPLDVLKSRGNEVRECKVEGPVAGRCDGDSLATQAQREELWWVDPRYLCMISQS